MLSVYLLEGTAVARSMLPERSIYSRCDHKDKVRQSMCPLQAAADRERQKAQAAASAERAAFEAQEARMAAELEQRTQQERRLLEEAAQRALQAAEQRRRCVT